jgi:hypothetical protein
LDPPLYYRLIPPAYILLLVSGAVNNGLEESNDSYTTGLVYRALDVSQGYIDYRARRFRQRFYTGFDVHEGEVARWFVLTESDEAIAKGLDLVQKFNELVRYLRRHYGHFEYCWVRHRQGDKKRINLHVVYFGTYIPQQIIEDWWWKNYASHRSKMGRVYNVKRQAWYLSGYLSGEGFERYHFSGGWVFPGWIGYSQWLRREFGSYPPRELLVKLGRMSKAEREKDTWFGLYLGEKKRGVL